MNSSTETISANLEVAEDDAYCLLKKKQKKLARAHNRDSVPLSVALIVFKLVLFVEGNRTRGSFSAMSVAFARLSDSIMRTY